MKLKQVKTKYGNGIIVGVDLQESEEERYIIKITEPNEEFKREFENKNYLSLDKKGVKEL